MLTVIPGFRELDVHFEPESRLLGMDFLGLPCDRYVEVLHPYLALTREGAEEPRQRLKDRCLAGPVRAKDVGEFLKVDGRRFRAKRPEVLEAKLKDPHVCRLFGFRRMRKFPARALPMAGALAGRRRDYVA
jgi:hypothetical protein